MRCVDLNSKDFYTHPILVLDFFKINDLKDLGTWSDLGGFGNIILLSHGRVTRIKPERVSLNFHISPLADQSARGLLVTDLVILNHGQVARMTPELAPPSPSYHTTPTGSCLKVLMVSRGLSTDEKHDKGSTGQKNLGNYGDTNDRK
ncbi:hypothetical protein TNCV_454891 [Trichonephila clavipes]|nr:hypothetical protein TNCV_454891 [Trichonephila clavipes]